MNRAFFFDRDRVLNEGVHRFDVENKKYFDGAPFNLNELRIKPDARKTMDYVKLRGYLPIVVTNQPDFLKREDLIFKDYEKITTELCSELGLRRAQIFECFHKPGFSLECECRKPKPGLFLMAKGMYDIDLANSWMVGDSYKDIEAANNAGIRNMVFLKVPAIQYTCVGNAEDERLLNEKFNGKVIKIHELEEIKRLI